MLDNQLFQLIISVLKANQSIAGIAGLQVVQAYQPTRQGVATAPTIYIHKIGDRRFGFRSASDVWDTHAAQMVHTETQKYETKFQLSALATQNPSTPNQMTASDIVNLCAYCLQSVIAVAQFENNGVGVLRVTDVRNPYFLDDRDQPEASPSFDFTLTHDQTITSTMPIVSETVIQIDQV